MQAFTGSSPSADSDTHTYTWTHTQPPPKQENLRVLCVAGKQRASKEAKAAAVMGARDQRRVESEGKSRWKDRMRDEMRGKGGKGWRINRRQAGDTAERCFSNCCKSSAGLCKLSDKLRVKPMK